MPQMGESVTEGTVLEWHKQEGEYVAEGETVVEVSTDKIDAEVPAPAGGVDHQDPRPARRHGPGRPGARRARPERRAVRQRRHRRPTAVASSGPGLAAGPDWRRRRGPGRRRTLRRSRPSAGVTATVDSSRGRRRPSFRSRCPRWASRSPRGPSSSGTSPRARGRARATPSSRSRPTRSTPRCPRRRAATITKLLVAPDDTVQGRPGARRDDRGRRPGRRRAGRGRAPARPPPRRRPTDGGHGRRASPGGPPRRGRRTASTWARVQGSGPGGKVTKADVLAAANGDGGAAATASGGHRRRGQAAARPRGDARQGDEREPLDADGDLVPHPRRRHPRREAQGAQRRAQGARDEGLVHAPGRVGDRQGGEGVAGDGPHLRGERRQAAA